jgi:membrane protease YdiL (CAAX protease family)
LTTPTANPAAAIPSSNQKTQPQSTALAVNSLPFLRRRMAEGSVTWSGLLLVLTGRTGFMLLAQGLVALVFLLRRADRPWLAAAPWWTVYGTLIDAGCLALMWKLTRGEGIRLRDLIGSIKWRYGRDFFLGAGVFAAVFPFFVVGGWLSARLIYGTAPPDVFPGVLGGRVLPPWAVIYSFSLWWMIWSVTEEMNYAGYALPRAQALSGRPSLAVALVGFWWAIQHSFLPFVPDWRNFVWRFLAFVPGVVVFMLIYLRTRRLAPLIVAHWSMDIIATVMTMR